MPRVTNRRMPATPKRRWPARLASRLPGPGIYGGKLVEDVWMGDGRYAAEANDIRAALTLYRRADMILIGMVALLATLIALA